MISELAFQGDPRGLFPWRNISGNKPYRLAATKLLENTGTVLIITGFYIAEFKSIETDGLTGTWVVANALKSTGFTPVIVTDETWKPQFDELFGEFQIEYLVPDDPTNSLYLCHRIHEKHHPKAMIAIERPGPNKHDRFLNWNSHDITPMTARTELLFIENSLTIGIGDGGNELGMGALTANHAYRNTRHEDLMCTVPAEVTLLGSTSDFAAFGLAAAVALQVNNDRLLVSSHSVDSFLKKTIKLGIVDGFTGECIGSVDGCSKETVINRYEAFRFLVTQLMTANSVLDQFKLQLKKRYEAVVCTVIPSWNSTDNTLNLNGTLLTDSLRSQLLSEFASQFKQVNNKIETMANLPESHAMSHWIHITKPLNLMDKPNGRLTTQCIPHDFWIRRLWIQVDWSLIQTPDLAMGWMLTRELELLHSENSKGNKWSDRVRAVKSNLVSETLSLKQLNCDAETYMGSPYLWGGRSISGIDCSGFTQALFNAQGVLLPRNSRDQRKCGIRISLSDSISGDLVFAIGREKAIHHVGICRDQYIQHACLAVGRVILESKDDFKTKYRIIAVRRIGHFA